MCIGVFGVGWDTISMYSGHFLELYTASMVSALRWCIDIVIGGCSGRATMGVPALFARCSIRLSDFHVRRLQVGSATGSLLLYNQIFKH